MRRREAASSRCSSVRPRPSVHTASALARPVGARADRSHRSEIRPIRDETGGPRVPQAQAGPRWVTPETPIVLLYPLPRATRSSRPSPPPGRRRSQGPRGRREPNDGQPRERPGPSLSVWCTGTESSDRTTTFATGSVTGICTAAASGTHTATGRRRGPGTVARPPPPSSPLSAWLWSAPSWHGAPGRRWIGPGCRSNRPVN